MAVWQHRLRSRVIGLDIDVRAQASTHGDALSCLPADTVVVDARGLVVVSVWLWTGSEQVTEAAFAIGPVVSEFLAPEGHREAVFDVNVEEGDVAVACICGLDDRVVVSRLGGGRVAAVLDGPDVVFRTRAGGSGEEDDAAWLDPFVVPDLWPVCDLVLFGPVHADVHWRRVVITEPDAYVCLSEGGESGKSQDEVADHCDRSRWK